jgi:hypothetical protein
MFRHRNVFVMIMAATEAIIISAHRSDDFSADGNGRLSVVVSTVGIPCGVGLVFN